jgi:hypothetical protein
LARKHGDGAILQVVQGAHQKINSMANEPPNEMEQKEIRQLFIEILGKDDLSSVEVPDLLKLL